MKNLCIPLSIILKYNLGIPYKISPENKNINIIFHDSRKIIKDAWFICLKGNKSDGHKYIRHVLNEGVKYIIYEPSKTRLCPAGIQVLNTNLFLIKIASWWRSQMMAKIILITGSNGKTSTKELLHFILSKIFLNLSEKKIIIKNLKSFNNHFGLPFTLLEITPHTIFSVVEAGSNHPGEIKNLSQWASPNYSLITSIQKGHIGHFKNEEEIAHEKSDILCGMVEGSHLIYPNDILFKNLIIAKAKKKNINFHEISLEKIKITNIISKIGGTSFNYRSKQYFLPLLGEHQFKNLILVIGFLELLCKEKRISQANIHSALRHLHLFKNLSGRMEIYQKNKITICNDSYNANPSSFEAAILSLSKEFSKNKLLGAFGYMAELGSYEKSEHQNLARLAAKHFKAITFFSNTKIINEIFRNEWLRERSSNEIFVSSNDKEQLKKGLTFLKTLIKKGDCILIKGSRSTQMERIFEYLKLEVKFY